MIFTSDYLLDTKIIVSPERAKRPHQYAYKEDPPLEEELEKCPFCPGNEHLTPEEHFRIEDPHTGWRLRIFPNKFKIWKLHDVIVDTPHHLKDWNEIELKSLFYAIKQRFEQILNFHPEVKWISLFRNFGSFGGASIRHSHLQLIGLEFIPEKISRVSLKLKKQGCYICERRWKNEILLYQGDFFRVLFVEASQPFEIEIHSIRHIQKVTDLSEEEIQELSRVLQNLIKVFRNYFSSYNVLFFNGPFGQDFHFFIRLFPRITLFAGFEFESGIIVNPVGKEKAFEFLGQEIQIALSQK